MKARRNIFCLRSASLVLLAALTTAVLLGYAGTAASQPRSLMIATPAEGTTAHIWTVAICNTLRKHMGVAFSVTPTSGAFEATNLLLRKDASGAFGDPAATYNAYLGLAGYTPGASILRQLHGGYDGAYHVVVRADSNIKTIADLRGKRFMAHRPGTPFYEDVWPVLLEAYGLSRKDVTIRPAMSPKEQTQALKEGRTDAFLLTGGIPNPSVTELSFSCPIRLLGVTKEKAEAITAKVPYLYTITAPANAYKGQTESTLVMTYPDGIVLTKELPADFVYTMTKTLFEHMDEIQTVHNSLKSLTKDTIATGLFVPLHAGAFRYYKEKGLIPANMERFHKDLLAKMKQSE
jgi:TRAP transporter TAXI family solute receptor